MRAEFRVLGPLEVWLDGVLVPLPSGRARVLLASLLLRANKVVSVDVLVDRLWDGEPPNPVRAKATLQMVVTRLRQALGEANCVRTVSEGYLAEIAPEALDLHRFRSLVEVGKFADALGLWRGAPLSDVSSDSLHRDDVPVLLDERLEALESRIDADLDAGNLAGLVVELRALTRQHPLRERFWAQLMLALYRSDQQAEALAAYRAVSSLLVEELGIDPGPKLRELHERILTGDDEPPARALASSSPPTVPRQLPPDLGTFLGRQGELDELDSLLPNEDATSKTVVVSAVAGAGGVGKTALVVRWAHRVRDRFPDGQLFINLRGYDSEPPLSSEQALTQLLTSMGVEPSRSPRSFDEQIGLYRSMLADRRMLVLLDNAATAEQVRPLLPASDSCCVLVTSRSDLRGLGALNDATVIRLDVLEPSEARQLLRQILRVTEIKDETVDELAALCGHLPLALRIAAANLAGRPQIAVERYLVALKNGDRLGELSIAGDRQAAVRGTFQLSYQALAEEPRQLFRLLGLAVGPDFSAPAAAALAGIPHAEAERLLDHLVDVHLLEQRDGGRYSFHDLIRLHAKERAAEEESDSATNKAFRRLLDFYLHSADRADRVVRPSRTDVALPELSHGVHLMHFSDYGSSIRWCAAERANLVAATRAAFDQGQFVHAWQIPTVLWGYFSLQTNIVEWDEVTGIALRAATVLGDEYAQAVCLHTMGGNNKIRMRFEVALEKFQEALSIRERIGHEHGIAATADEIGNTLTYLARFDEAIRFRRQAIDMRLASGNKAGWAITLNNLAFTLMKQGELSEAFDVCTQAIQVCEELGMHPTLAAIKGTLVEIQIGRRQYDDAIRVYRQVLAMPAEHRDSRSVVQLLIDSGEAFSQVGDLDTARDVWREAAVLLDQHGDPRAEGMRGKLAELEARVRVADVGR